MAARPALRNAAIPRLGAIRSTRLPTVNHVSKGCARRPQPPAMETQSMALKVELKPHEQVIIGSCVITNTEQRAKLLIQGEKIPILREKDILTPASADTP